MRIGEILVQLGMLTPEQLQAFLASQDLVVVGPRFGTQLAQRGLVTTDQVSEALGHQLRVPAALQRHFDKADPAVVALLKPNLAARYMAIPLVAARSAVKRTVVAMATPQDMLIVDDVAFALGTRVEPMIAAELAIARNLKRFYGIDVSLAKPTRAEAEPAAARSASSREIRTLPADRAAPVILAPLVVETPAVLAPPPEAAVGLEDAVHRLSVAEYRDQIADILIDFMLPRFGCGIIFRLRDADAKAWRGYAPGIDSRNVETIAFPMSMPSMFRVARDRAAPFRGPPPSEGSHLQNQIWKYLRCPAPAECLVIPVTIAERIVLLVYAHANDAGRLPESAVQELQAMCTAIGSSLLRLIQQAKEGKKPPSLAPL